MTLQLIHFKIVYFLILKNYSDHTFFKYYMGTRDYLSIYTYDFDRRMHNEGHTAFLNNFTYITKAKKPYGYSRCQIEKNEYANLVIEKNINILTK